MSIKQLLKMTKFRSVSHCIFDLDGLLIDSEAQFAKGRAAILKRFGHDYPLSLQEAVLGLEADTHRQIVIDTYKLDLSVEELKELERADYTSNLENVQLMPGAERVSKFCFLH